MLIKKSIFIIMSQVSGITIICVDDLNKTSANYKKNSLMKVLHRKGLRDGSC